MNTKDAVKNVTSRLNSKGVLIKEKTVAMIINSYIEYKRDVLLNGDAFYEDNICTLIPKFRRCNSFDERVVPTIKLQCNFDNDLKGDICESFCLHSKVRNKIAPNYDIENDEIEYLRRKYEVPIDAVGD